MSSFNDFLAEQLQDPEIKAAYDADAEETWTVEIDTELYEQAKIVFSKYSLTVEAAFVLFLKTCLACGGLPFPYQVEVQ